MFRTLQLYRLEPRTIFSQQLDATVTSIQIRSGMWYIPVAQNSVFRLEELAAGNFYSLQPYNVEYMLRDEKWVLEVQRNYAYGFTIYLRAPASVKTFAYKPYVRTNDKDIVYGRPGIAMGKDVVRNATTIVGAEITVEPAVLSTSSWNFESSEQMQNWDVILCMGDTKFYAHKTILSFASSTFRALFEGDFREKKQQEIPVSVEGTDASYFEAFLQCLYPCGSEPKAEFLVPLVTLADFYNVKQLLDKCVGMLKVLPNVSNVDKLRVAIKLNSTSLEDAVIASLSKADIGKLIAAGFKDLSVDRLKKIASKCHSMIP